MIYTTQSRGSSGPFNNIGCLVVGVIMMVAAFYILRSLYIMLWWAAPALFVLALIINWNVVAATGKWFWALLQKNPLMGLLAGALGVYFFPVLTLFWFLSALGSKRVEKMQREFGQQFGGAFGPFQNPKEPETEFTDFEELESKPIKPTTPDTNLQWPPAAPEKEEKKPKNPYDNMFE